MATLTNERIAELLEPYALAAQDTDWKFWDGGQNVDSKRVIAKLSQFLDLIVRWNAKTNLTAIRDPEAMVERHFGESLFAAAMLRGRIKAGASVMDFGSGAGFPGIPMQLACPDWRVTLAESQGKKSAFLREVVRTLGLSSEVWAERVEAMPVAKKFDCVTMRAVDRMDEALREAIGRVKPGGWLAVLAGAELSEESLQGWEKMAWAMPGSDRGQLVVYQATLL